MLTQSVQGDSPPWMLLITIWYLGDRASLLCGDTVTQHRGGAAVDVTHQAQGQGAEIEQCSLYV